LTLDHFHRIGCPLRRWKRNGSVIDHFSFGRARRRASAGSGSASFADNLINIGRALHKQAEQAAP